MITAGVLGTVAGIGLAACLVGLFPPRLTLAQTLAALHPRESTVDDIGVGHITTGTSGWAARAGRPGVPLLLRLGLPRPRTRADLAICDRDPTRHLAEQAAAISVGVLLAPLTAIVLTLGGIPLTAAIPAWASLALAGLGWWLPEHRLRSEAARRRTELRSALSGLLDLVVVSLAGGAGVEQALRDAADEPATWGQHQLQQTLNAAQLTRQPPWQTLAQLGVQTNVPALTELSAALSLAGSEGAAVRATLTARAASLREHDLSDAEAAAASATEKMSLPVVGLFGGFLVFIGFPALSAVLDAL